MKFSFPFCSSALLVGSALLFAGRATAQQTQLADDPPSYFGSISHQSYVSWLAENDIENKYTSSVFVPSKDGTSGAAVHWTVDDEYFHVAVAAPAAGWVGFGLSEAGGMLGSDMAIFTASRPNEIVDAHVVDQFYPKPDDCQQDWILEDSSVVSGPVAVERQEGDSVTEDFIMFQARRKLDTGDLQDIKLIRDNNLYIPEQRIIAAWSDTPEISYHGPNVARGSIRVFKQDIEEPSFDESMANNADGSFFVGANSYVIPADDTTYADFCISRDALIAQGVPNTTEKMSVIGFRPVVAEGPSAPFVHHYVVTGIFNPLPEACTGNETAGMDIVYVWAPGDGPFALPEFLGANLFGDSGFQGFNIEIHYDNPRLVEGIVDSSGVEIYYTTTPREVEMGVLQVGDPLVSLFGEPVGEGYNLHAFECPGSCSSQYLDEPVTVIREYLHMHVAGSRMTNEHIRNGEVVRTASVEVWDFDQNGNVAAKQDSYQLMPGDSFRTSCYYNGKSDTVFGLSSQSEMCMAFLYYYPRKTISTSIPDFGNLTLPYMCGFGFENMNIQCNSMYNSVVLESDADLDRQFGQHDAECVPTNQNQEIEGTNVEASNSITTPAESSNPVDEPVPETEGLIVPGVTSAVSGASSNALCSSAIFSTAMIFACFIL